MSVNFLELLLAFFSILLITAFHNKEDKDFPKPFIIKSNVKVNLYAVNGCGVAQHYIISKGNPGIGAPPLLGSLGRDQSYKEIYNIIDTLPGTFVVGVLGSFEDPNILNPTSDFRIGVATDSGAFFYDIRYNMNYEPLIVGKGSILLEDIVLTANNNKWDEGIDKMVFVVKTNDPHEHILKFYKGSDLSFLYDEVININPERILMDEERLYITGYSSSNDYVFIKYNLELQSVEFQTNLSNNAKNNKLIYKNWSKLYLLSSPLDALTNLIIINTETNNIKDTIIYNQTGFNAASVEFKEYLLFQPLTDVEGNQVDKNFKSYNPNNNQFNTNSIFNKKVDYIKGMTEYSSFWTFQQYNFGASRDNLANDTLFVQGWWGDDLIPVITGANPDFIGNDFRCWYGIKNTFKEKTKFKIFPNPFTAEVNIEISGLDTDKSYVLEILDEKGRRRERMIIKAKENYNLPFEHLTPGIYFMNLHSEGTVITQKVIKQ